MKKQFIICALSIVMLGAFSCSSSTQNKQEVKADSTAIEIGFNGLFFSTQNVMEEFEVGTSGYYVVYDDPDAGMYDEVVRLTFSTYAKVLDAIKENKQLCGTLKAIRLYETVEYELDEEEM